MNTFQFCSFIKFCEILSSSRILTTSVALHQYKIHIGSIFHKLSIQQFKHLQSGFPGLWYCRWKDPLLINWNVESLVCLGLISTGEFTLIWPCLWCSRSNKWSLCPVYSSVLVWWNRQWVKWEVYCVNMWLVPQVLIWYTVWFPTVRPTLLLLSRALYQTVDSLLRIYWFKTQS